MRNKRSYTKELAFAKRLASEAGNIIMRYFRAGNATQVQVKEGNTFLTIADLEINKLVIIAVQKEFPRHSVWGEEDVFFVDNATHTWVCDPLDGTMPYAKGLPISTFSLALVDGEGRSVLGVVYDPFEDRLFEAVRGKDAYMNGARLRVSDHKTLAGSLLDNELWINEKEGVLSFDDPRDQLNKAGARVSTLCSAVITGCLVAEGAYDAMFFGQNKPEDIAALSVIVEEAGGQVTDLRGKQQRYDRPIRGAIVSNGALHAELVQVMASSNYKWT